LRYATQDDNGVANPLANYITRIYTEISSQPGRMFNDFRRFGFNEDDSGTTGRKVFDGHMQWISAGSGIGMNFRFSQSGRTERNRQDHLFGENVFPFANVSTTDPFTGITASRYDACQATNTCAFGVEIYSANEYWVKTASLLHTQPNGSADLPDSPFTRNYFMSSMQHGTGNATNRGACQQFGNPLNSAPVQRALFLALDAWANNGTPPPASRVPRLDNQTLVLPISTGFPTNIPDRGGFAPSGKVTYTGLKTNRYRFNFGPGFYDASNPATYGIPTFFPPARPDGSPLAPPLEPLLTDSAAPTMTPNGPVYPSFVPKTDSDGNDIAGVRLVDVTVPLATYTGWGLRSGPQASDGCESTGQFVAFAKTPADRVTPNGIDPRPSVLERYPTFSDYYSKVVNALNDMTSNRLLLCEDVATELNRLSNAGVAAGVPPREASTGGRRPTALPVPSCMSQ
jgi:hypothetical protein